MTAQIGETLLLRGDAVQMCSQPLGQFFQCGGHRPAFEVNCTALWRGYVGTWEARFDRLYMTALSGRLEDGGVATLETLFPGYPGRVFAHWYSGTLRIPEGRQLEYIHAGYASRFERDRFLVVRKGVVVAERVRENGVAAEGDGPEGYGIGAMTVFPGHGGKEDSRT